MSGNANIFGIVIGAIIGFVCAILYDWGMMNLFANLPELFKLVMVITLILSLIVLVLAIYRLNRKKWKSGIALLVFALGILIWLLFWYLPIFSE